MTSLPSLACRTAALQGWRRRFLAVLLGASTALALPPLHILPVLLIAFPALIWLLDGARGRWGAFGIGWWFGFGHFSAGLYWVSHALLTEPERWGWLVPFAVGGLGAGMGLFIGLTTLATRLSGVRGGARVLMFAAAWTFMEWLRSWVLTGFPWNLMGNVWAPWPEMLQLAAFTGVYGLSFVTVLVASLPALLGGEGSAVRRIASVAAGAALLAGLWVGGAARLPEGPVRMVEGVHLRLVQANIAQNHKWRDDLRMAHLAQHVALSQEPADIPPTHVIWPETAAAYFLDLDPMRSRDVALAAPPGGLVLTGAPRATPQGIEPFQVWNSLKAVNDQGQVIGVYDKAHLVPFGEYMPLRGLLPFEKLTHGSTDFSAGPGPQSLTFPGLPPVSPLICYEVIFPGAVIGEGERPEWMLNITNDGWFGISSGPYQHLASARMRAVEEGLPLVRAANTGISAVIDPWGRSVAELELGTRGVIDSPLPGSLGHATLYGRYGNTIPLVLIGVAALAAIVTGRMIRRG
ncbi:apolipoprotein N-acyltransferase [Telmatospirillum sp. J64-1]|uniref:apolipoprotein N-acyltransferase n=1 Tax=Telmatospirillum sp. J64-1 TaxID=2502183 RepID=UPI0021020B9C|nr:apolipoprotein N-acyltransferase [Telmatospirillum sp. J64-1]